MKPIWLYTHPEQTLTPNLFSHSVIAVYVSLPPQPFTSSYVKVAAVDADDQADRIILVQDANNAGWDMIELDEQITRQTITGAEYEELRGISNIPVGVTSTPDALIGWTRANNVIPDLVLPEYYDSAWLNRADLVNQIGCLVIGAVNYADQQSSSSPATVEMIARTIYAKHDGIWFWGANTGNPQFEAVAQINWPTVQKLLTEWSRPLNPAFLGLMLAATLFITTT